MLVKGATGVNELMDDQLSDTLLKCENKHDELNARSV